MQNILLKPWKTGYWMLRFNYHILVRYTVLIYRMTSKMESGVISHVKFLDGKISVGKNGR